MKTNMVSHVMFDHFSLKCTVADQLDGRCIRSKSACQTSVIVDSATDLIIHTHDDTHSSATVCVPTHESQNSIIKDRFPNVAGLTNVLDQSPTPINKLPFCEHEVGCLLSTSQQSVPNMADDDDDTHICC
ncbi:unnamed protein product [Didymodactylos carnosus]|uniref:Uncharacterized protein n=1 Tax=Didymodactylos carnosus TaxID=1234261 RepID=A0A814D7B4_9BILA|nr:unnamed protein product [Didymodactylos carnosus]CAF1142983.1 unnamed protein product [Didymodactylos carnosus]CAF3725594.1 unnamed protein product [Didymodactylos carnosus]CAF3941294.1 unnamed protein product [Didymodactylos carnosus]